MAMDKFDSLNCKLSTFIIFLITINSIMVIGDCNVKGCGL